MVPWGAIALLVFPIVKGSYTVARYFATTYRLSCYCTHEVTYATRFSFEVEVTRTRAMGVTGVTMITAVIAAADIADVARQLLL